MQDGHYVEEVDPGGPAERAGLKTGDRVIQINGMNIEADDHEDVIQSQDFKFSNKKY